MKAFLLVVMLCAGTALSAQVPIIDYSFLAVPPSTVVNKVIVQPDGKILVGGGFNNYAGTGKNNLVRLNNDGTVDATFNPGGSGPNFLVQDMDLMPDGRILIAGNFGTYNGIQNYFVARLFPNGALDPGFHVPPNSINNAVYAIALHRNNTVLVAGDFFICAGHSQPHITRFDSTGVVDTTFLVGTGFDGSVYDLLVLPDQRIVAGGSFYNYQGNWCGDLALLGSNGLHDASMDTDPGFVGTGSSIRALALQPDGKLLAAGNFGWHAGVPRTAIARLDMSGAYDASFISPLYPYAKVDAIAVQADGHILAGGEFTANMYTPAVPGPSCLIRMNADGSRDNSYDLGIGAGAEAGDTYFVRSIAIQQDNNVLVGGRFTTFDTETQYQQIIRLHGSLITGISERADVTPTLNAWWDSGELRVIMPPDFTGDARLNVYSTNGQLVHSQLVSTAIGSTFGVRMDPVAGLLLVSLEQGNARLTAKVMVP